MKYLEPEEGYDLYAADYKKDHAHLDSFDWEESRALLMEALQLQRRAFCPASQSQRKLKLLDLGCGDGRTLKRLGRAFLKAGELSDLELNGWDASAGMLAQAKKILAKNYRSI